MPDRALLSRMGGKPEQRECKYNPISSFYTPKSHSRQEQERAGYSSIRKLPSPLLLIKMQNILEHLGENRDPDSHLHFPRIMMLSMSANGGVGCVSCVTPDGPVPNITMWFLLPCLPDGWPFPIAFSEGKRCCLCLPLGFGVTLAFSCPGLG